MNKPVNKNSVWAKTQMKKNGYAFKDMKRGCITFIASDEFGGFPLKFSSWKTVKEFVNTSCIKY